MADEKKIDNSGKTVKIHYKGTLDDGEQFDSSYDRGEPIEFVCMRGDVVKGFDDAVVDMEVGEKKSIHLEPEDAYGEVDEQLIQKVPLAQIPNASDLPDEGTVYFQGPDGRPIPAEIVGKDDEFVTFDMNHPLAGKALNFDLELVEIN